MLKSLLAVAVSVLTTTSLAAVKANAQSCPNARAYGVRQVRPVDNTLRSQIEVTYFSSNDPHAFVSERNGIHRSASYISLSADQFLARLAGLERQGAASVRKRQSATSYLGDLTELNLERESVNAGALNASLALTGQNYVFGLERETEVSVYKGAGKDGGYYRVSMLSWFVDVTPAGATKTVDYDASILLKPGQTAVFKLMGDDEVRRSGAARSHMAITLRSVDAVNSASLERSRGPFASR
jgi:hypothetical protein